MPVGEHLDHPVYRPPSLLTSVRGGIQFLCVFGATVGARTLLLVRQAPLSVGRSSPHRLRVFGTPSSIKLGLQPPNAFVKIEEGCVL